MELEITFGRMMRVWWGWFWRNLLLTVVAVLPITFLIGVIIGVILAMLGIDPHSIRFLGGAIGIVMGFAASIIPIWLILGKQFGSFRLVLVEADDAGESAGELAS